MRVLPVRNGAIFVIMDDEVPTRRARRDELLVHVALRAMAEDLAQLPPSPHARELRAKARMYEETVARWAAQQPSDAQVRALRELVNELQALVTDAASGKAPTSRTFRER